MKWLLLSWIGLLSFGMVSGVDGWVASLREQNLKWLAWKMAGEAAEGVVLGVALVITVTGHRFVKVGGMSLFWWLMLGTKTIQTVTSRMLSMHMRADAQRRARRFP